MFREDVCTQYDIYESWGLFIAEDSSRPFWIGAFGRAQICFDLCNDGTNTHFGTQYGEEVWMYVCTMIDPVLCL